MQCKEEEKETEVRKTNRLITSLWVQSILTDPAFD